MKRSFFDGWGFPAEPLFLSAGPCSAESEEQVVGVAHALKEAGISFYRAGIWKPRTRPGGFEGVGMKGLAWMDRARRETGLKIGTEVAEPAHVEACLAFGLDLVWVGARTTTNPFSVQAIADALRGSDIPVLVKNPISPDIGLWVGAIERLERAGIRRIGAIHRGFSSLHEMRYRNAPDWKVPIELKRIRPDLPMICDPSHITGAAGLIRDVAQEALDLLFDGLMIEVHSAPAVALSDAAQQLTPAQFIALVGGLELPREDSDDAAYHVSMVRLRNAVDDLDGRLLDLLGERMRVVREMGTLKRAQGVSTLQPERWKAIMEARLVRGESLKLAPEFVTEIMQAIHEEAIRQQEQERLHVKDEA